MVSASRPANQTLAANRNWSFYSKEVFRTVFANVQTQLARSLDGLSRDGDTAWSLCCGVYGCNQYNKLQKCWQTPVHTCSKKTRPFSGGSPSAAATLSAFGTSTTKPLTFDMTATGQTQQKLRRAAPRSPGGSDHPQSSSINQEALACACSANAPAPASSRNHRLHLIVNDRKKRLDHIAGLAPARRQPAPLPAMTPLAT